MGLKGAKYGNVQGLHLVSRKGWECHNHNAILNGMAAHVTVHYEQDLLVAAEGLGMEVLQGLQKAISIHLAIFMENAL